MLVNPEGFWSWRDMQLCLDICARNRVEFLGVSYKAYEEFEDGEMIKRFTAQSVTSYGIMPEGMSAETTQEASRAWILYSGAVDRYMEGARFAIWRKAPELVTTQEGRYFVYSRLSTDKTQI